MRDPSRIRVPGPLEPYAEGFRCELAGRGYSPGAAVVHLQLMAHLSGWLAGRGLDTAGLTSALVDAYLAERRRLGCASHWTPRALAPLLGFLRRREVVPAEVTPGPAGPVAALLGRYARWPGRGARACGDDHPAQCGAGPAVCCGLGGGRRGCAGAAARR